MPEGLEEKPSAGLVYPTYVTIREQVVFVFETIAGAARERVEKINTTVPVTSPEFVNERKRIYKFCHLSL